MFHVHKVVLNLYSVRRSISLAWMFHSVFDTVTKLVALFIFLVIPLVFRDDDDDDGGRSEMSLSSQSSYDPRRPNFQNKDSEIGSTVPASSDQSSDVVLLTHRLRPDHGMNTVTGSTRYGMVWYSRVQRPTRHSIGHFGDGGP